MFVFFKLLMEMSDLYTPHEQAFWALDFHIQFIKFFESFVFRKCSNKIYMFWIVRDMINTPRTESNEAVLLVDDIVILSAANNELFRICFDFAVKPLLNRRSVYLHADNRDPLNTTLVRATISARSKCIGSVYTAVPKLFCTRPPQTVASRVIYFRAES